MWCQTLKGFLWETEGLGHLPECFDSFGIYKQKDMINLPKWLFYVKISILPFLTPEMFWRRVFSVPQDPYEEECSVFLKTPKLICQNTLVMIQALFEVSPADESLFVPLACMALHPTILWQALVSLILSSWLVNSRWAPPWIMSCSVRSKTTAQKWLSKQLLNGI